MNLQSLSEFAISSEILLPSVAFEAPACLVHTNFLRVDEALGRHHCRTLYVGGTQTLPEVRLCRLPRGVALAVQTDEDFIPYAGGQVLAEQVRSNWTDSEIGGAITRTKKVIEVPHDAMLAARYGLRTWGHWLGELLPKIVGAETAHPGRFRYVLPESIASDPHLKTMHQSLDAYGIGRERLLLVRGGNTYRFTNLFAVSPVVTPKCAIHPGAVAWLRRIIDPGHAASRDIALLRRESNTRNLSNLGEVMFYLAERGFSIVDIGHLDFIEQVRVFSQAENIVSILGSGLTGLIFAPQNVGLVTLAPGNWADLFFFSLMQERHARLVDLRGRSEGDTRPAAARAPFSIDTWDLEGGLRALGLESDFPRRYRF